MNLTFDSPKFPYFDLSGIQSIGNLNISANNCNLAVWIYLNINYSLPVVLVSYFVDGNGTQKVNLGLNTTYPTSSNEWNVVNANNEFLAEGENWTLLPDNSIIVPSHTTDNVTIMHLTTITNNSKSLFHLGCTLRCFA